MTRYRPGIGIYGEGTLKPDPNGNWVNVKDVVELALCEQDHLILKPDVYYVFTAREGCKHCMALLKGIQS